MKKEMRLPVSCNKDCGAGCALTAFIEDDKIVRIADSEHRPSYMRGCLKGYRGTETLYHKDRITKPLIRKGPRGSGDFQEASWDEALDLIAGKLEVLQKENRLGELMRLGGSGSCRGALHNTVITAQRFLSLLGGYTDTSGSYSSAASTYVKTPIFGTPYIGIDARTLLKSDHIILWGFNPSDTRFDSETEAVLKEASEKGIAITVIDPRKTRTVKTLNAQWIPLLPGSDTAFMLAVLWTLIDENKIDRQSLNRYSSGFDQFESYVTGEKDGIAKTPIWAEEICGYPADKIREFARSYGDGKRTALIPGLSLQRAIGGENADRLGVVLQLATGNAGRPGGSTGASEWNKLPKPKAGRLPVPPNPLESSVPVYRWADAVLEGRISFLYNVGGNFLGQGSDTAKTIKAYEKTDFSVTHDYFLTDTARYSDVVLPVTTFLEREDLVFTSNNYLFYSAKAVDPQGESKNDFTIFAELAQRLGFAEQYTEGRTEEQWIELFLDKSEVKDLEAFKEKGIHTGKNRERIGLASFFENPDVHPLETPSGKIEIASEIINKDGGTIIPEHIQIATTDKFPLRMVTPHEKYRIHSQNDNIPSLKKLCDDRLWINERDASERSVKEGDTVVVTSPDGSIQVSAHVTDEICSGTVSLNQGVWAVSGKSGANANYLTSTEPTLPSHGSRTHSIIVEVLLSPDL